MTFKSIPGYPNYEINEEGVVRNINTQLTLKPQINNAYFTVTLGGKVLYIHYLVALTFIGERPNEMVTRHLDGNPHNNCLSNIEYGSRKDNTTDRTKHGTWGHTLTERAVRVIRGLYKCGFTQARLSRLFKLNRSTIARITSGKTWKYCIK